MQVFKDNVNRDWSLSLTIGTAMKVKDTLGVDLLQPEVGDPPLLTRLGTDELLLAQVIAALLESQFELHKVDAEQIYQSFDGPTFARAHEAFYKELIDFFQKRGRQDRATAVAKQMKMITAGISAAVTKIDGIDVDKVIDKAMSGVTFGESEEASTSIGNTISKVFSGITGAVKNAAASVYAFLNRFTEFRIIFGTINIVRGGLDLLGKTILWIGNSIVKPTFSVIFGVFRQLVGVAVTVAKTVGSALIAGFRKILGVVSSVLRGVVSIVATVAGKAVSVIGSVFSGIASLVGRVLSPVLNIIGTVFQGILKFISPIGTALKTVAGWIVSFARSFFVVESSIQVFSLLSAATRGAASLFSTMAGTTISAIFSIAQSVPTVVSSIVRFFISLPGQILNVFSQIPRIVGGAFSTAVGVVKTVVSGIGNVFSGIATFASNIFNGLVSVFQVVFNTLGSIVSGFGNFFLGAFTNVGVAVDWLREQFGNLLSFASETVGAIAAALGRGDIEAAIGVVWATIKLIWTQGTTSLVSTWHWLTETLQTTWATCVYKISELLSTAWYGVQEFWTETVYTMSTLWTVFSSNVVSAWKTAEQAIAQGIGWIIAKIEGLDPNEMANIINEDYNRQSQQREAQKSQALTGIQKNRDDKMSALKSEKDGTLDILKSDFEKSAGTRDAAYQAKLAAQQKELDAAKAAYDEAINRAKDTAVSTFCETAYFYPWFLTSSYVAFLTRAYGCVNSSPFRGFSVGEVRFLGASGGYRQGDKAAELTFKFAVSPNAWNIRVGSMTIPFKYGWDYLWVRWADLKRGNVTVKVPIEAYVEKVYQGLNFYSLGIG